MSSSIVLQQPLSLCSAKATQINVSHSLDQKKTSCSNDCFSFKLLFVEEGKGCYQIEHRKILASTGTLLLISLAGVNDTIELVTPSKNWVVTCQTNAAILCPNQTDLFILPLDEFLLLSFLKTHLQRPKLKKFEIEPKNFQRWLFQFQQLEAELQDKSFGFTEMVATLLYQLLINTIRLLVPKVCQNRLTLHPLLPEVFRFIEANYHRHISLCDVAKKVNCSPAYLTDLVRRKTGRTVVDWIIQYRMTAARHYLLKTTYTIEQISEVLGYLEPSYFIRQFRQIHGITPHAWRSS